jgi:CHAT domain-containing protein
MSSKLRVLSVSILTACLAVGVAHAEGRQRAPRAPSPGVALNRQRMEALRPALEQYMPLTADVSALQAEWDRRLSAAGARSYASIVMTQRACAMGTRAAEESAIPKLMVLAIRELHSYLAGYAVDENDDRANLWPSALVASGGYTGAIDLSFLGRTAALLSSTAKVFANPRVELEALATMARSMELQGRTKEAFQARKAALELAANTDDRTAAIAVAENGGATREEAERAASTQVTERVSDFLSLVPNVIVASPEPELQPAIRKVLQRAAKVSFTGLGGVSFALAAHAAGQYELARAFSKEKSSAAMDGEAIAREAFAKMQAEVAAQYGVQAPPMVAAQPTGPKDPASLLRLSLLDQLLATEGAISTATWEKIAKTAAQVDAQAAADDANANRGGEHAHAEARTRAGLQQRVADAKRVIDAFELSPSAEALAELYAPMEVSLPIDLSYLLDRIADRELRLALVALDVKLLERGRATLDTSDRTSFFGSVRARRAYRSLLAAMIDRGKPGDLDRALAVGELTRARQLKDLTGKGLGSFEKLLGDPSTFAKRALKAIGAEGILLSFHELDAQIVALVVAGSRIQVMRVAQRPAALDALAEELRKAMIARRDVAKPLRIAHELLIRPVLPSLAGKKSLIIVPDGELGTIPFEALTGADGKYLIEGLEIRYVPAVALLTDPGARHKADGLYAMGDPEYSPLGTLQPRPLHDTREEVQSIAKHFAGRSSVWLGGEASESELKAADLSKYGYVHLATHGILGGVASGYLEPGLLLTRSAADDGVLTMSEAQQLKLSARLAVLSACDTGRGERIVGEGALSISRAFLLAGADAVVVSLWPVDTAATTQLMVALYDKMAKGATAANALQAVKLEMMRASAAAPAPAPRGLVLEGVKPQPASYAHPFYWSAFVVVGG